MNIGIAGFGAFTILALSYIAPAALTPAKAHGKPMNTIAYCNAEHNPSGRGPSWSAKYYPGPGQWWCEEAQIIGWQILGGGRKLVTPSEGCWAIHNTKTIHTHRGLDYAVEANMHCGEYEGLAPSMADMQPASIKVCNRTSQPKIAVGIGYLERVMPPFEWISVGYWPVERGKCFTMPLPDRPDLLGYRGDAYVFGFHPKAVLAGAFRPLCARRGPGFQRRNAHKPDECPAKGYEMIPTTRLNIQAGENTHVFSD